MGRPVTGIQHNIFRWARESLGLSVEDVANKMHRSVDDILSWENGTSSPTYPQLETLAYTIYKRPIAIFFLPEAPTEELPSQEFRTLPDTELSELYSNTYINIRKGHAFQLALKDLFQNNNPSNNLIWHTVMLDLESDIQKEASHIRTVLDINFDTQCDWKTPEIALKEWRKSIESCGIFVFKSSFKQKDISGFCLTDELFPIIYLNNSTTKTRQIFSLLHELAHILFEVNGLSKFDKSYFNRLPINQKKIEVFCNAIAAEVLVPQHKFELLTSNFPYDVSKVDDGQIEDIANKFSVSRESVLRKFLDLGRVTPEYYSKKAKEWKNQMKKAKGGGDYYATTNAYLSERFSREIIGRHYRHEITVNKASELLGIKPKNFSGLERLVMQGLNK